MKKSITKILITLIISMMGVHAYAYDYDIAVVNAEGVTIYYKYINDGTELEVWFGEKQYEGEVIIPEEVVFEDKTLKVTAIGSRAFYSFYPTLTSVTIPNSVTSIGEEAFSYCSSLESVTIPGSVITIGDNAFANCFGMESLVISNGVKEIGYGAFYNCSNLISVDIPESVDKIGDSIFSMCHNLTSVTLPSTITSIGNGWFMECENLQNIVIPEGVTSIGASAFHMCKALKSLTIPSSVTSIGNRAFTLCNSLTSMEIPNGVTSIEVGTFQECNGLTSITIPNSVTKIKDQAFYNCNSLTSVVIPNGVDSIGASAFYGCTKIDTLTIGSGIKEIRGYTFSNCRSLVCVYCYAEKVPNTEDCFDKTPINNAALYVVDELVDDYKMTLPWSGFGKILGFNSGSSDDIAVDNAEGITIYYRFIKDETELIVVSGENPYSGQIIIPEEVTYEGKTMPVTAIGNMAFKDCSELFSVTIPESVISIGDKAFSGCSILFSVNIPNSVISLGVGAFYGCGNLYSLTIGDGLTSISDYAFMGSGLSEVIIPDGITSIGEMAFYECVFLNTVNIGKNVTSIGANAFMDDNISTVISQIDNPEPFDYSIFSESTLKNVILYVPKGCESKYRETNGWNEFAQIKEMNTYDSLLDEEKVWTVKIESLGPNDTYVSYMEYKLMDNVSIDGISCRQLFTRDKQEGEDEWSEWQPGEFGGTTYISEDSDGKVYYDDTNMKNFLLMDFSMQEGDVYRFDDDYDVLPFIVTAVSDTILENSFDRKPRKCIFLSQIANGEILTEDYHRDIWIEGVGSVKHGLMGMRGKMMSGSHLLMKCTQQGNVIYQNDNVSSVQGIKKQLIDDTSIYNLNGQRIAQPKKGIYIQNGKKLVIK